MASKEYKFVKSLLFGDDSLSPEQAKTRMLVMYLFTGVITTIVNFIFFTAFNELVPFHYDVTIFKLEFDLFLLVNQTIAWLASVIVAYITNRAFVFVSNGNYIKEFFIFATARIVSFFLVELGTFSLFLLLLENVMKIPQETHLFYVFQIDITALYLIKLMNSVILVILNFVMSKIFVFKKNDNKAESIANSKMQEEYEEGSANE